MWVMHAAMYCGWVYRNNGEGFVGQRLMLHIIVIHMIVIHITGIHTIVIHITVIHTIVIHITVTHTIVIHITVIQTIVVHIIVLHIVVIHIIVVHIIVIHIIVVHIIYLKIHRSESSFWQLDYHLQCCCNDYIFCFLNIIRRFLQLIKVNKKKPVWK